MIVSWFGFLPIAVRFDSFILVCVILISSCWVHIWKEFEDLRKRKEQWIKASYRVWCVECHYLSEAEAAPPPHTLSAQQCARTSRPLTVTRASTVSALSAFVYLAVWLYRVTTKCQCMCLCVCVSTTFTQSVLCVVCLSVFWITASSPPQPQSSYGAPLCPPSIGFQDNLKEVSVLYLCQIILRCFLVVSTLKGSLSRIYNLFIFNSSTLFFGSKH